MQNTNETFSEDIYVNEKEEKDTMGILNKFCWPGFIMPQFWGICNGLKIGLIAFIPILYPFIGAVFGFCGYNMAYEKRRYNKKTFYEIQLKWRKATIIYLMALIIFFWSRRKYFM